MSDTKKFPAGSLLLASGLGSAAAVVCLAVAAWLMVKQGISQDAAGPLATASVSFGSFCGGLMLSLFQKRRGLFCGAVEGIVFTGMLFLLGILYQSEWGGAQLLRAGIVLLTGMLGGILGMLLSQRRRP